LILDGLLPGCTELLKSYDNVLVWLLGVPSGTGTDTGTHRNFGCWVRVKTVLNWDFYSDMVIGLSVMQWALVHRY
jgi:hypothetical protein